MSEKTTGKQSFKDTLNLPQTDFPIRPNFKEDDQRLIQRWEKEKLFFLSFEKNKDSKKFILHDGPPYANGNIHLGTAYNKILKDIVCKAQRMCGLNVPVTPGWDCHGLPIELKVLHEKPELSGIALKKACRTYAQDWLNIQRNQFKALGILMNWDHPYVTMDPIYESKILRAFGKLFNKGFIERKNKTVPWCAYDQTVLASAEIEYKERKDPSIYALFELKQSDSQRLFHLDLPVSLVVWTTTPWTLPLNRAVLAHPNAKYVLLSINNKYIIIGAEVSDDLCTKLEIEKKICGARPLKEFNADELKDLKVKHPFLDRFVPIILDENVGTKEGTAFVHCAPGCGQIDYEIGVKNNLEIFSPISSDGKYTFGIEPKELENMPVTEGQIWVIKKLIEAGKLLYKTNIKHSYPHCWRCKNGLIFRATPQWFFDLSKNHIQERAVASVNSINFIPEGGRNFLRSTIENRWEWCLSRQRTWGVPIPALLCKKCDLDYLDNELIEKVAAGIEKNGIEYWDTVSIDYLVKNTSGRSYKCKNCGAQDFKKEQDILDVWFESGISHYAVLYDNDNLAFPADMYLEGVDQHRGWFQSSLLTSLAIEGEPSMKTIMTHGYIVDEKGQKMSKSLGNVVEPQDVTKNFGVDVLRLWVSSVGHEGEPVISNVLLQNTAEVYRKIRNTCRFLLSNLYDYDHKKDAIEIAQLYPIDYYALTQLEFLNGYIIEQYLKSNFTGVFHAFADYCTGELSSFYLDIVKDRLYVEKADGLARRSAQTALWYILDTLTKLIAPIASFTAELVSDNYQKNKTESIHLQNFVDPKDLFELLHPKKERLWPTRTPSTFRTLLDNVETYLEKYAEPTYYSKQWESLRDLRSVILKAIEIEREKGLIKHSLEAKVILYINLDNKKYTDIKDFFDDLKKKKVDLVKFLKEFLIVSQVSFVNNSAGLNQTALTDVFVNVKKADGIKCPRCWQYDIANNPDGLCNRCQEVLNLKV